MGTTLARSGDTRGLTRHSSGAGRAEPRSWARRQGQERSPAPGSRQSAGFVATGSDLGYWGVCCNRLSCSGGGAGRGARNRSPHSLLTPAEVQSPSCTPPPQPAPSLRASPTWLRQVP
ncbi:hypothetical protein KIL84_019403 [Mauremys mutica]|uniref:Uncharacterized protein n=1 Tax=Mauremys mutica TaxID=74926 RepID=A0A9D3XS82_9SAUR|nr:hypothetical protein KIL84_019403 [Mauremys mutica]